MAKTVLALYDDFETARNAVEALVDAGFDRKSISLVANNADERYSTSVNRDADNGDVSSGAGAGFGAVVGGLVGLGVALIPGIGPVLAAGPLAAVLFGGIGAVAGAATGSVVAGLVDLGMDEEEAGYYAEGIRRGGALVSVDVTSDEHTQRAEDILNRYNPVDVNERGESYRESGWTGYDEKAQPYTQDQISKLRTSTGSRASTGTDTVRPGEQQKLEVVEEQLNVGKREVEGDTVRVRTRVTERPAQAQVNLREEKVVVERHPVDRAADPADVNAFQEATIEMKERHEEAVVSKSAHVVEEVTIGTQSTEHTETVQDSVRRKDVEVEGATGSQSYADYETRFRNIYNTNYGSSGSWEEYSPAYRYGYDLANDTRYSQYDWDRVESEARTRWEAQSPNTWDRFKANVREAWDEVRGRR